MTHTRTAAVAIGLGLLLATTAYGGEVTAFMLVSARNNRDTGRHSG